MQEIERSAPSVEEAVEAALAELGASEQEVLVQIMQEPRSGFLGVGSQEAIVRVRLKGGGAPTVDEHELDEQAEIGAEFLEGLLERLGLEADVEPALRDGTMYLDILAIVGDDEQQADDDMALLIGRRGQTLDAIQELTRMVVAQRTGLRPRVIVDVEDYRKRQRSRLAAQAKDVARRVARTGAEEELEPMNSFERKIVHDAVATVPGAESSSRGEDPDRRVVIRRKA